MDATLKRMLCEICTEQFQSSGSFTPRLLNCGHTFCEGCVRKLYSKLCQRVPCPRCKHKTECRKVSSLPKNYSYIDLIEEILERRNSVRFCSKHPQYILDMFCESDGKAICLYCAIFDEHKTHRYSTLSGFCEHERTSVIYESNAAKHLIKDCNELREEIEARKLELTKKGEEIQENINLIFNQIKEEVTKILNAKLENALADLERWFDTQMDLLDANLKQLDLDELIDLNDEATSFLQKASEYEIAQDSALHSHNMYECREEIEARKLYVRHQYEVKIHPWEHIIERMKDLLDGWSCNINETGSLLEETIQSTLDKHLPPVELSLSALFSKELENTHEDYGRPFQAIDVNQLPVTILHCSDDSIGFCPRH